MSSQTPLEEFTEVTPIVGAPKDLVWNLDFSALYPSILVAHNLEAPTTLPNRPAKKPTEDGDEHDDLEDFDLPPPPLQRMLNVVQEERANVASRLNPKEKA